MSTVRIVSQSATHSLVPSLVRDSGRRPPDRPKRALAPVPSTWSHSVGKPANTPTAAVVGSTCQIVQSLETRCSWPLASSIPVMRLNWLPTVAIVEEAPVYRSTRYRVFWDPT